MTSFWSKRKVEAEVEPPAIKIIFSKFLYAAFSGTWDIYSLHRTAWDPDINPPLACLVKQSEAEALMAALDPHESERINKLLYDGNSHAPLATSANISNA